MKLIKAVLIPTALVFSFGCDKKKSGGGNPGGDAPRNREEAFARLSPEQKQTFEKWQNQVVKSCDPGEAFGIGDNSISTWGGVDLGSLIKSNNGSLVFSSSEQMIVLGDYQSFRGVGTSKVESSYEINGRGQSIVAETKRNGSHCELLLYGQPVYEAVVAESVTITSHWLSSREVKTNSAVPTIRRLGAGSKGELTRHGINKLVRDLFKPSKEGQAFIAQKLGLQESLAANLFKVGEYNSSDLALRIDGDSSAVWSANNEDGLVALRGTLEALFDGSSKSVPVEVRLGIPSFKFKDLENNADRGTLKFTATVGIAKTGETFEYQSQKMDMNGFIQFGKDEGLSCVADRASSYLSTSETPNTISPSVSFMYRPCRILYSHVESASYESGLMKTLIAQVFAGVMPIRNFRYGEWDSVLSKLALEAQSQGKDIRQDLDPNGKTVIVGRIAGYVDTLSEEIERSRHLDRHKATLLEMGFQWAFNGESVSSLKISEIVRAVDNSIDTFEASTKSLLLQIGQDSNSNASELSFAAGIDLQYKTEALKALSLSKELQYDEFERDVFNKTIQKKVTIEEWQKWSTQLTGIKGEINRFANIGTKKGELVGLAVKWLNSGDAQLEDLGSIYAAIDNAMIPFESSANKLVADLSKSLVDNKASIEFARAVTPEFKQLALSIRENSKMLNFESWGQSFFETVLQKMPSIDQVRAWNDLWTSAISFSNREKERTKGELSSIDESSLREVISKALDESWSSAEFQQLEVIAPVARGKNTCERDKGYSSLARCGGLRLFSKSKNMFFDSSFSGRYVALGQEFVGYVNKLQGHDWTILRWDLVGAFFGSFEPIWSKCDQSTFSQRSEVLKNQISAILAERDQFKKWELERKIEENIENCR